MKDEVDDAKEKLRLIREKISEELGKDFEKVVRECYTKYPNKNDALVAVFDKILFEKMDKKLQKRGSHLCVSKLLKKPNLTEHEIKELEEVEHEVYMEWLGFDPLEEYRSKDIKDIPEEEIEESFQRLLERNYFIADPQLVKDLPKLIPHRLDKKCRIEKTETPEEVIEKYQKPFGNEIITYMFITPKDKYKETRTPTFGGKARKALLAMVAFAVEENTFSPKFRKFHILRLMNGDKIANRDYSTLDNILQTLAFTTYDIENKKKGKEYRRSIGHIIDNVDWFGRGKNSYILVSLNKKYFSQLTPLIEGKEKNFQYLRVPKDRLAETLPKDEAYFLNYVDSLKGQRNVYPILVKTVFKEKLGYTNKKLKNIGPGKISSVLNNCLETAKKMGRLKDPYWEFEYGSNRRFKNILCWKVKLYLKKDPTAQEPKEKSKGGKVNKKGQEKLDNLVDNLSEKKRNQNYQPKGAKDKRGKITKTKENKKNKESKEEDTISEEKLDRMLSDLHKILKEKAIKERIDRIPMEEDQ